MIYNFQTVYHTFVTNKKRNKNIVSHIFSVIAHLRRVSVLVIGQSYS